MVRITDVDCRFVLGRSILGQIPDGLVFGICPKTEHPKETVSDFGNLGHFSTNQSFSFEPVFIKARAAKIGMYQNLNHHLFGFWHFAV